MATKVKKIVEAIMGTEKLRVRIMVSIAGTLPDGTEFGYEPGQVVMLDAELAAKWLAAGHAEAVAADEPITETAALSTYAYTFYEHPFARVIAPH